MTDRRPPAVVQFVPPLLAVAGWLGILAVGGADAWPLLLGWLAGIAAVALVAVRTHGRTRLLVGLVLTLACVALTWVGGLFFVPSALALAVLSLRPDRPHAA